VGSFDDADHLLDYCEQPQTRLSVWIWLMTFSNERDEARLAANSTAQPPSRGLCFGYEIRSELVFNYLRPGSAPPLQVHEGDGSAPATAGTLLTETGALSPRGEGRVDVYASAGGYDVDVGYAGWFRVDPSVPLIVAPESEHRSWREAIVLGIPMALCVMDRGDLMMHAAAVEVDGGALVIAAPGGHGKTTLSAAFARNGHRLLAEDLTCCRLSPQPAVLPGPAMLRLRRDVADKLDIPGTQFIAEDTEKIHLAIEPSARGDGAPVPIKAMVLLREADSEVRIDPVPAVSTLSDLWRLGLNLPTTRGRAELFGKIADLADRVPVWNVTRRLRIDLLDEVMERVISTCLKP
jgi:hypothetical protein